MAKQAEKPHDGAQTTGGEGGSSAPTGKHTHMARLSELPVDLTMEDGQVVTIEAPRTGRFHVLVTTPKPAKAKRRKR